MPVDARKLRLGDMRRDPGGTWFEVALAKTGREAIATLSPRAARLFEAYLANLPAQPIGAVQIFCNRSGRPYLKDTLGDDFRDVRANLFGPDERRQLADFRRSGAAEDLAGNLPPEKLASKMATPCRRQTGCTRPTPPCSSRRCAMSTPRVKMAGAC